MFCGLGWESGGEEGGGGGWVGVYDIFLHLGGMVFNKARYLIILM